MEDLAALWTLAGSEEQSGDLLFFAGEPGAAPHYHEALRAVIPPGSVFASREDNDRRMQAHERITEKIRAIGPDGAPRADQECVPHPEGGLTPERIAELRRAKAERDDGRRRAAALKERLLKERAVAIEQRRKPAQVEGTEFEKLFRAQGHWSFHGLGNDWREAGKALADSYPAAAATAFDWSIHYFGEYNREWTRGLPASRWDSDGGAEIGEVQQMRDALGEAAEPPPEWIRLLVTGEWTKALVALGTDAPPPDFQPLVALFAKALAVAGGADKGRIH